jgi:hypothetical protein
MVTKQQSWWDNRQDYLADKSQKNPDFIRDAAEFMRCKAQNTEDLNQQALMYMARQIQLIKELKAKHEKEMQALWIRKTNGIGKMHEFTKKETAKQIFDELDKIKQNRINCDHFILDYACACDETYFVDAIEKLKQKWLGADQK